MIERDYGHIVGIASMAAIYTIPFEIIYCATKCGVRGLHSALYDELCVFGKDKNIKLSTVYPGYVNTRKQLIDALDPNVPRIEPEVAAKKNRQRNSTQQTKHSRSVVSR